MKKKNEENDRRTRKKELQRHFLQKSTTIAETEERLKWKE